MENKPENVSELKKAFVNSVFQDNYKGRDAKLQEFLLTEVGHAFKVVFMAAVVHFRLKLLVTDKFQDSDVSHELVQEKIREVSEYSHLSDLFFKEAKQLGFHEEITRMCITTIARSMNEETPLEPNEGMAGRFFTMMREHSEGR